MAKYKFEIKRVERYSLTVVVDADIPDDALKKVEEQFLEDDYLYEKLTDSADDTITDFRYDGVATEQAETNFINI